MNIILKESTLDHLSLIMSNATLLEITCHGSNGISDIYEAIGKVGHNSRIKPSLGCTCT